MESPSTTSGSAHVPYQIPARQDGFVRFVQFAINGEGLLFAFLAFLFSGYFGAGYYSLLFAAWVLLVGFLHTDSQKWAFGFWLIVGLIAFSFLIGRYWHRDVYYEGTISSIKRGKAGELIELHGGLFNTKMSIYLPYRLGIADQYSVGSKITASGPEITYYGVKEIAVEDSRQVTGD